VPPSNPRTAAQQAQRNKFSSSLTIVRNLGPSVYQDDWNRAIGQLPGFQSLMSIMMNAMDTNLDLSAPPTTPLGDLHLPQTIEPLAAPGEGEIGATFSDENGPNGTPADVPFFLGIPTADADRSSSSIIAQAPLETRGDGSASISTAEPGVEYLVAMYFHGEGTAEGLISPAAWFIMTAGS